MQFPAFKKIPVALALALTIVCVDPHVSAGASAAGENNPYSTVLLAGGHLPLCASSNARACKSGRWTGAPGFERALYRVDKLYFESALATLPASQSAARPALLRLLQDLAKRSGAQALTRGELLQALEQAPTTGASDSPIWPLLLDDEQDSILSAFEIPQFAADGRRKVETVSSVESDPKITAIYQRMVREAARAGGKKRPVVLIVTASSRDPFASVDYYLAAFTQAGADARWLPLDPALLAAQGGADLIQTRAQVLGMVGRERVYPDLHAQQRDYAENKAQILAAIRAADGIFLNGGDQTLMYRTWFSSAGIANPYWQVAQEKLQAGRLVIGGTSAGTAVQSLRGANAAMLSGGESWAGLSQGAQATEPSAMGCFRARRCSQTAQGALTFSSQGGLGSFPFAVLDTHFSERGRQWRMAALLRAADRPQYGLGVDEATAVVATWPAKSPRVQQVRLETIGQGQGWWFERESTAALNLRVLNPGSAWTVQPLVSQPCDASEGAKATLPAQRLRIDDKALAEALRSEARTLHVRSGDARAPVEVKLCRQKDFWRWQW